MDMKESWQHFRQGKVPASFDQKLQGLDEASLRDAHKRMQRKKISGGTAAIAGGLMAVPSCGVSLISTSIGSRRMAVNTQRINMIERRLNRNGWRGHTTDWKDYALPITMTVLGAGTGIAVDGIFDAFSGSGGASTSATTTPSGATFGVEAAHPTGAGEVPNAPAGVDTAPPPEPPAVPVPTAPDAGVVPPPPAVPIPPDVGFFPPPPDVPAPPDVGFVPPPPEIPNIAPMITPDGIQLVVDGTNPIDPSYEQVVDSGLYQQPLPGEDTMLAWGDPSGNVPLDPTAWEVPPQDVVGGDPAAFQPPVDLSNFDPAFFQPAPDFTGMDPTQFQPPPPDVPPVEPPPVEPLTQDTTDPSDVAQPDQNQTEPEMPPSDSADVPQQFYGSYIPGGEFYGASNAVGGAAAVGVTHLGMHISEHLVDEVERHLAKKGADQGMKRVVKSTWEYMEKREEKTRETTAPNLFTGMAPHHLDCLALLEIQGYHFKLNDPERLRFFITQADGNAEWVKIWIEDYLREISVHHRFV